MLDLNTVDLIPTHNRIRDPKSVRFFVNFLREGRVYRCQEKPITLVRFEDNKIYIRDGHRRLCAAVIAGANKLFDCEFRIEESTYDRYKEAHYETGWFTPFDPRTHCRLPDFFDFKTKAESLYEQARNEVMGLPMGFPVNADFKKLNSYVKRSFSKYCEPRTVNFLGQLVQQEFETFKFDSD